MHLQIHPWGYAELKVLRNSISLMLAFDGNYLLNAKQAGLV